ncbi:MAG: hypothetical protein AB1546_03955, partial [bacterium]
RTAPDTQTTQKKRISAKKTNMKIRVWAEYFTPKEAMSSKVMKLLKRYDVCLAIAFPPGSAGVEFAKMMKVYQDKGIEVALWVLLPDESGYWISERNADEFSYAVHRIYDWAGKEKFHIPWIAVDLEPPYYQLERIKKAGAAKVLELVRIFVENIDRPRFYDASRKFEQLQEFIHSCGSRTLVPVIPPVIEDIVRGTTGVQNVLESPVTTVQWDVINFMVYTSMITGYMKRMGVTPADARWYLYTVCSDAKRILWDRAAVSLGVTYTGKLENEPYYESPDDLLPDFEAVKAALIDDVAIYNLEGIMRSRMPERWFETLLEAVPSVPERSFKVNVFREIIKYAVRIL